MITKELIVSLHTYGLSVIQREKDYCLVDIQSGECYEDMSIYYIYTLLNRWDAFREKKQ